MSKAILVLDEMPENCYQCPCFIERYYGNEWHSACYQLRKEVSDYGKPKDCPLKPMPERFISRVLADTYEDGWNDCIDEILGETE